MGTPTAILVALALGGAGGHGAELPAAPPAVPWTALHFQAHKLMASATSVIRHELLPATALADRLREPPGSRGIPLPPMVVQLSVETDLPLGRDEQVRVWLDPVTFAALQTEKRTFGKRPYEKLFRYTSGGYYEWRRGVADEREALLPPQQWSDLRQSWAGVPGGVEGAPVVADPYALLYMVSAAQLQRPGRHLTAHIVSRGDLVVLEFGDAGLSRRPVDYWERWPGGERRRRADALVRLVHVRAVGRARGADNQRVDLGFWGMQDGLTIALDAGSGVPLEFSGRARTVGSLVVRLGRAELAVPPD